MKYSPNRNYRAYRTVLKTMTLILCYLQYVMYFLNMILNLFDIQIDECFQ
jgi:hypothetical protein